MPYKDLRSPAAVAAAKRGQERYRQTEKGKAAHRRLSLAHYWRLRATEVGVTQLKLANSRARRKYRVTMKGIIDQFRTRARGRGMEWSLADEEMEALFAPMRCAVTGMELTWEGGARHPLRPSLDRVDNALGYVSGNVQCVAWWVNRARGDTPLEEFKAILAAFKGMPNG